MAFMKAWDAKVIHKVGNVGQGKRQAGTGSEGSENLWGQIRSRWRRQSTQQREAGWAVVAATRQVGGV